MSPDRKEKVLEEIAVRLLDEANPVWRPVKCEKMLEDIYRVSERNNHPAVEEWEHNFGDLIIVRPTLFDDGPVKAAVGKAVYWEIGADGELKWMCSDNA